MLAKRLRWGTLPVAMALLAVAAWSGLEMLDRLTKSELWGYLPLSMLGAGYLGLSLLFFIRSKASITRYKDYLASTVIGLMMGLSFPDLPFLPLLLLSWVMLYRLLQERADTSIGYQWRLWWHAFILWNIISTYWISNTAFAAGVVAIIANTALMTLPLLVYQLSRRRLPARHHFVLFIVCWLTFEYIHFRWEAHWPWLTLGHYFMEYPSLIQWYSYTGVLGGTLWVLLVAGALYSLLTKPRTRKRWIGLTLLLIVPMLLSWWLGTHTFDVDGQVDVVIVQPNQEPHYVKGTQPAPYDIMHMIAIADSLVDDSTDVVLTPETSFDVRLNRWSTDRSIDKLDQYLDQHEGLSFVMGMGSSRILLDGEPHDEYTRTYVSRRGDTIYWENHNAALSIRAKDDFDIYYKSKLVPGAEFYPFKDWLFFIKPLVAKLGGSASGLRMQPEREVFNTADGGAVAPIICYESVFGAYVSDYIAKGADWMAVVTNDGWWDQTAGHRQHLGLSVLRAIEQRRWIARSANTGISGFIDPYGRIHQATRYNETVGVRQNIDRISYRTVYSRTGDIIGRLAMILTLLMVGYALAGRMRRGRTR